MAANMQLQSRSQQLVICRTGPPGLVAVAMTPLF
eukprot:CAMPEP_0117576346 /NCGR_PEP_ID=MMETSP0784-20121206/62743_1 /TAXON_ID=39447 /ORGANISM="" /LENGTH=33 /DNA_ID= /DNA_START= /DNA_END= /DNA_ORIENTATION=